MDSENINVNHENPNAEYKPEPKFEDFKKLGEKLEEEGLDRQTLLQKLYNELGLLVSTKGFKWTERLPVQKLVQIYLPWDNKFYLGYINNLAERKENKELIDVHIEMKLVAVKHDTRKNPIPTSLDKYSQLEKVRGLSPSLYTSGVLNREGIFDPDKRLRYHIYSEEKVEVLEWMKHKTI